MARKTKDVTVEVPAAAFHSRSFRAFDRWGESIFYFLRISVAIFGFGTILWLILAHKYGKASYDFASMALLAALIAGFYEIVNLAWALFERNKGVDLDNSGEVGDRLSLFAHPQPPQETTRIIPYHRAGPTVHTPAGAKVDEKDLAQFLSLLHVRGATRRDWTGEDPGPPRFQFGSGRHCDPAYFNQLIGFLESMGWISERGPGKTPNLPLTAFEMVTKFHAMAGKKQEEWPDA